MRSAWTRKSKGCCLANAVDAFSCEENDAPLCFSHSLPRLISPLQMGGLSLTRRLFNARFCDCSTEGRAVRTRASCSERLPCKVKTCSRLDSAACRVRSTESTTFWMLCKNGWGVSGCFADCSVDCQIFFH